MGGPGQCLGGRPAAEAAEPGAAAAAAGAWEEQERLPGVEGLQDLSVSLRRHSVHGTVVVLAKVGGPLCSAGMLFATEAGDDKGLPHCLEHLCFMGSRRYQKGYLDFLATRCGCEGTNAYTETDHTCFEFTAAGETGLLAVLPVFVDHVLCPALSADAFVTEIFHVNGKGERQGVVFSEMLGRMNAQEDILDLELHRATFGDSSPYSFETGGLPDMIAKLSPGEITKYHRDVYTTDNLYVVLSGTFDEERVLSALSAALDGAVARGAGQRCQRRPFVEALPGLPPACPRRRAADFPSDDVSVGAVAYTARLPGVAVGDVLAITALDVLGRFLAGLSSSPLEQEFVQCEPPVASGITCEVNVTAEPYVTVELQGVPFRASLAERRASKKLGGGPEEDDEDDDSGDEREAEGEEGGDEGEDEGEEGSQDESEGEGGDDEDGEGPDWFEGDSLMQRLADRLQRVHDALLSGDEEAFAEMLRAVKKESVDRRVDFEDGAGEFIKDALLPSLIFSRYPSAQGATAPPDGALWRLPAHAEALRDLAQKPASWWAELLQVRLLAPLRLTLAGEPGGAAEVRSRPSAVQCLQNERREEKEAKATAKKLGKKKLKALQDRVDAAEEAGRAALDEEARSGFPQPVTPDCVPDFRWSMGVRAPPTGGLEVVEVEVPSGFVELHLSWLLDESALGGRRGAELRPYLSLFAALMCDTDVAGEGYRSVVARLDDELVSYSASVEIGSEHVQPCSSPCQLVLKMSAEPERAGRLVAWADLLAHECQFPEEKVLSTCRRLVTGIKERMREGEAVLSEVATAALHGPTSPQVQLGSLAQRPLLQRCVADVAGACQALQELRDTVTAPGTPCMAVVSAGDPQLRASMVAALQGAWLGRHEAARPSLLERVAWAARPRPAASPLLPPRHLAVGCAGSDTAHVHLSAGLASPAVGLDARRSWALRLLCEALSMMEGPLSTAVRGKGLAYGASVGFESAANAVTLDLWECTNVRKALEAALSVVRTAAEGGDALSPFGLDNARGSLVFDLKGKRATPTNVTCAAVGSAKRGWRSVAEVSAWEDVLSSVTTEDVLAAHEESLSRLCDAANVVACVVCDPGGCAKTAKGFAAALGLPAAKVFVKENISDCFAMVDARVRGALEQLPA